MDNFIVGDGKYFSFAEHEMMGHKNEDRND